MPRLAVALLASAVVWAGGCAGPRGRGGAGPPMGTGEAAAREVLGRFAEALEAGRFGEAHALLSRRWRAGYTPGRLALDFHGAGPSGRDAAARVRAHLAAGDPIERTGGEARLAVGGGRAAVLVAEAGAWRVDALE